MKRHSSQDEKQKTGSFYTENVDFLLSRFSKYLYGKNVIDPFVGSGHLLDFAEKHGAISLTGCDIKETDKFETRDSLMNPPDMKDKYLLTNPPYLCKNKSKEKEVYEKWCQNDKYKCHLVSLIGSGCKEGTIILPSNFLSESNAKARNCFFSNYRIIEADYYYYQAFEGATTGIVVFSFERWEEKEEMIFNIRIHFSKERIIEESICIKKKYKWLYGDEFFDYINKPEKIKFRMIKERDKKIPNTKIIISLLDKGKYKLGAHFNNGTPLIAKDTVFFTYQLDSSIEINEEIQRKIIDQYNFVYNFYREKYHGLFIANYMGAEQKLKSVKISNMLLNSVAIDILGLK